MSILISRDIWAPVSHRLGLEINLFFNQPLRPQGHLSQEALHAHTPCTLALLLSKSLIAHLRPIFLWDGGYHQIYLNRFAGSALVVFNSRSAHTHTHTDTPAAHSHHFLQSHPASSAILGCSFSFSFPHPYSQACWGYYKAWLGGNQSRHLRSQKENNAQTHTRAGRQKTDIKQWIHVQQTQHVW